MKSIVRDFDAEQWRPLLVEDVPGVQASVHSSREEHWGPGGAPAAIGQVLSVGAETKIKRVKSWSS